MSKMVSFLAGLGGGYIQARDKQFERDRQAKEDAYRDEQRGILRAEQQDKARLKTSMRDAVAERSTMDGTAVTDGAGNANLYKDPMQAQAAADEAKIEAEMRGQNPATVTSSQATGVVGNMSQGNQIKAGPVDVAALNTRDAKFGRMSDALMAAGDPEKAIGMENMVMENKAKTMGLETAQYKFADEKFNRTLQEEFSKPGDFWANASGVLTNTALGGLAGVSVSAKLSEDGKTVSLIGTKEGGEPKVLFTSSNDARGKQMFMQQIAKADTVTKISYLKEQADRTESAAAAAAKSALDERKVGVQEARLDFAMSGGVAGLRGGGGGGGSAGGGSGGSASASPSFNPYEGFDAKDAQAKATSAVDQMIESGGKPVTAQERARLISDQVFSLRDSFAGQNASRQRTSVFLNESRKVTTPQEVEALRARAMQSGYTMEEMAALDPRFAVAAPAGGGVPRENSVPATRDKPPGSQRPPAPSMAEIQQQSRAMRAAALAEVERIKNAEKQASADPRLQEAMAMHQQLIRAGRAADANNLISRIKALKQQQYGIN